MTVSNRTVKTTYAGNNSRTTYPIIFPLSTADGSDIEVWLTSPAGALTQLTSNFAVDIDNLNVVYPTPESELLPLPDNWKLTLLRNIPLTQEGHWDNSGPFQAATLETILDRMTMTIQQLDEEIKRAPKYRVDQTPSVEDTEEFMSAVNVAQATAQDYAAGAAASCTIANQAASTANAAAGAAAASAVAAAEDAAEVAAYDGLVVHKAGAEAITGIKTFSSNPVFNTGAISDAAIAALSASKLSGAMPAIDGAAITGLTKSQVGLGNVDNTSDANKPVSTAQQTALNLKANIASPTFTGTVGGVTAAMVGLGSVDNTADSAKAVLSATKLATARTINGVSFDGTANITVADATKVPTSTTVNGHALSGNVTVSASDVGLGSVNNTSDADKPVSTAQQTALNLKANLTGATFSGAVSATNLSGTNTGDQTNVSGNAGTATKLATAREINGVNFDGSASITVLDSTKVPTYVTVNGHELSGNVTVTAADVSLGNLTNAAQIEKAIGTTKGDIIAFTASGTPVRVGIGTDAYVLTADAASSAGLKWAVLPASGAPSAGVELYADQLENPNNADWKYNSLSPVEQDNTNNALAVRSLDDTTREGFGFPLRIPTGATNMAIKVIGRPKTATSGNIKLDIAARNLADNGAVGAWGNDATLLNTAVDTAYFKTHTLSQALATWGYTAGGEYQVEISRDPAVSGDLTGDFFVRKIEVSFT